MLVFYDERDVVVMCERGVKTRQRRDVGGRDSSVLRGFNRPSLVLRIQGLEVAVDALQHSCLTSSVHITPRTAASSFIDISALSGSVLRSSDSAVWMPIGVNLGTYEFEVGARTDVVRANGAGLSPTRYLP